MLEYKILILRFFSISMKEGCLSLAINHFGEILDTLIPRRRIFGRLQCKIHSVSIRNDASRCSSSESTLQTEAMYLNVH